jgi:hypothetical protein
MKKTDSVSGYSVTLISVFIERRTNPIYRILLGVRFWLHGRWHDVRSVEKDFNYLQITFDIHLYYHR